MPRPAEIVLQQSFQVADHLPGASDVALAIAAQSGQLANRLLVVATELLSGSARLVSAEPVGPAVLEDQILPLLE